MTVPPLGLYLHQEGISISSLFLQMINGFIEYAEVHALEGELDSWKSTHRNKQTTQKIQWALAQASLLTLRWENSSGSSTRGWVEMQVPGPHARGSESECAF